MVLQQFGPGRFVTLLVATPAGKERDLKGYGYLISIVSVFLLAVPALKSAQENMAMAFCLVLGMAASITGMGIRWLADLKQKSKIREVRREAEGEQAGRRARAA